MIQPGTPIWQPTLTGQVGCQLCQQLSQRPRLAVLGAWRDGRLQVRRTGPVQAHRHRAERCLTLALHQVTVHRPELVKLICRTQQHIRLATSKLGIAPRPQ